ncbi:MAG: extensin family protein [Deltaproteobacteria bacterium]|nr:extensin family protein [Deltaproteobacteria bacterium]MCW5803062.1 extensin family protein [Deltaproteobacteria bacterium]
MTKLWAAVVLAGCGGEPADAVAPDAGPPPPLGTLIEPADCRGALALYGVAFQDGPVRQGVEDGITATVPINGISYRVLGAAAPRGTLFADCRLILSLARAASTFRYHGVVEVADLGVYNYRCIGSGTPPNCPNGMSQHAYAMGIDLAGFKYEDGTFASVNDDWVIDPGTQKTCEADVEPGLDAELHSLICDLKAAGTWNIVLTPNYNADHRNHFHVDLTPGADFIRKRRHDP